MFKYRKVRLSQLDPETHLPYRWDVVLPEGQCVVWRGMYTGPLVLEADAVEALCWKLLQFDCTTLDAAVAQELQPVTVQGAVQPSLILHGTTPELKSFESDLSTLANNGDPRECTPYTEIRAAYFARPSDLAIGRICTWKSAIALDGIDAVEIPGIDYYYLSHALLKLAESHLNSPMPQIERMVSFLQSRPDTVARLYALEQEMQIFLIWLKRLAGLKTLYVDANSPEVGRAWNRKSVLHPTVNDAVALTDQVVVSDPQKTLATETKATELFKRLGLMLPLLPGYTIERSGNDQAVFVDQILQAAQLLKERYGLRLACLKASSAGDGARITPGIDIDDETTLQSLSRNAYQHGDDYVLEAHINYQTVTIAGEMLQSAPSAHIRRGQVADGATLQFTDGTSWKGNVYFDESSLAAAGISIAHYRTIRNTMHQFLDAFRERHLGLTIAGIDFAIGQIGGVFGDKNLLGVQDLNISFNGAECLRAFVEKIGGEKQQSTVEGSSIYAATLVIRPMRQGDLSTLRQITDTATAQGQFADTIAAIPERWGMIAAAARTPEETVGQLTVLRQKMVERNLIFS